MSDPPTTIPCPFFTTPDGSTGIYVPYKCCLSTMVELARTGICRQATLMSLKPDAMVYGIVRHPMARLESFIRDKCWHEPKRRGLTRDVHESLLRVLDPDAADRLRAGRSTVRDILDALERGMSDPHTDALADILPACTPLKMEHQGTFMLLRKVFGLESVPQLNRTNNQTGSMTWTLSDRRRFYRLRRRDFERFRYYPTIKH